MLYKLTLYVTHIVMHKRIRQIVISLLIRTVTRACVNAVTKYRLTMYIYIIRCLSAAKIHCLLLMTLVYIRACS